VKLTDRATEVKVDISFNMNNGVKSADLIRHFKSNLYFIFLNLYLKANSLFKCFRVVSNSSAISICFEAISFTT